MAQIMVRLHDANKRARSERTDRTSAYLRGFDSVNSGSSVTSKRELDSLGPTEY
jgi:hypothetical protein